MSVADLADKVGLSPSPCWRRIKRLEDVGVIRKRVTLLDPEKLGLGFEVYISVKLSLPSRANLEAFEARLEAAISAVKNPAHTWTRVRSGLEDVFISLMDQAKDNFA